MEKEIRSDLVESVNKSDILATWNCKRSRDQLIGFIARREAMIADMSDVFSS